jgi:glyoxylase-like metal-dependent hydrolase (beta-lactamase superfamily II)
MSALVFLTEAEPPRGEPFWVAPGIRRLVADNAGPLTYHGTNTYLIDGVAGTTVLDPGPDNAAHVRAIVAAAGRKVARIFLSHGHADHAGALPALVAATGAAVFSFARGTMDGAHEGIWTALHTPGHAADHLCFARNDGVVFTGDLVLSFATTVIGPPPDGDMAAYMTSLRRLLTRDDALYLPGHGPSIADPHGFVAALLAHRMQREAAILQALCAGPRTVPDLVAQLYVPLDVRLRASAEATVAAHLSKALAEGRVERHGEVWSTAPQRT